MPNTSAQTPYKTTVAGIGLGYGDTVPDGAVNLAYVQTTLPAVPDVIRIEDDLSNAGKYTGNILATNIRTLNLVGGEVIDPQTQNLWVAPTDNVLFTTVTAPYTDSNNAITQIPLFYSQELRFPIDISGLSQTTQDRLKTNVLNSAIQVADPQLAELNNLVNISLSSNALLPKGHLFQVLPSSLHGSLLYLRVFTNFKGTYKQSYNISWGNFRETLNVNPTYFQHRNTPNQFTYVANGVRDNSVGSIQQTAALSNGTSTAHIVSAGGQGSTNQPRTSAVSNTSSPSVTAASTNQSQSQTISLTTDAPYFINGPSGYSTISGAPTSYTTGSNITPPRDINTALTLNLTTVSCTTDPNGSAYVQVTLYDPTGIPLKTFPRTNSPQNYTFYDQYAQSGTYTWTIQGIVDDSKGIIANVPQGTYTYSASWAGSLGWYTPLSTTYTSVAGKTTTYSTPVTTLAPTSSATALSFAISQITVPSDPYGSTSYTVVLKDPNGNTAYTWTGLGATSTLTYPLSGTTQPAAPAGSWSWVVYATTTNNGNGTSNYFCSLQALQQWYVSVPGAATLYNNSPGTPVVYQTSAVTIPPTSSNSQLQLDLLTVNVQADTNGSSSLTVQLIDPNGKIAKTWANIVQPQSFYYSSLSAVSGQWSWKIFTTCANLGVAISSYTDTWTGNQHWHENDPNASGNSLQNRLIGFTFQTKGIDSTIYATQDAGPQVFVQEPDDIDPDSNWYLRLHRGYLNYTDASNNTYLVGIEPYYQQNFDNVIPLIKVNLGPAAIINRNQVQVSRRPIYVGSTSPIDVVVTRRTPQTVTHTWVTRSDGTAAGAYDPTAINDINGPRGIITLNSTNLLDTDRVHVTYDYVEYYYTYRGMPDAFGRFVHLDVNPRAGHTWMNLWNIQSTFTSLPIGGSGNPYIDSDVEDVATLLPHTSTINAAGTATITQTTQSVQQNVRFNSTLYTNGAISVTQVTSSSTQSTVNQIVGSSTASIAANPLTSIVNAVKNAAYNYTSSVKFNATPVINNTIASKQNTGTNSSSPSVVANSVTNIIRSSSNWGNFTNTWTVDSHSIGGSWYAHNWLWVSPSQDTINLEIDVAPSDYGSRITTEIQNMVANASYPFEPAPNGILYPGNYSYNGSTWTNLTAEKIFKSEWILISPGTTNNPNGFQADISTIDSTVNITHDTYNPYFAQSTVQPYTGLYQLQIAPQGGVNNWADNINFGTINYTLTGQARITGLKSVTSTTYNTVVGSQTFYPTDSNTKAPIDTTSKLSFSFNSVTCPSDVNGNSSYSLELLSPSGVVLNAWSGITSPGTYSYFNINAAPGKYQWVVWASAMSANVGSGTYNCSANVSWNWEDNTQTTSYNYSTASSQVAQFVTSPLTTAPTSNATKLSLTLTEMTFPSDSFGAGSLTVQLSDPSNKVVNTWVGINSNQTLTYFNSQGIISGGAYTWSISTVATPIQNATSNSTYSINGTVTLDWIELQSQTIYTYTNVPGIGKTFALDPRTIAPTSSASQLSFQITSIRCPSDTYGTSNLQIKLTDPNGLVVGNWTNITSPQTLTYSNPTSSSGTYVWDIIANAVPSNNGTSSYVCSFGGQLSSETLISTSSYPPVSIVEQTFTTPPNTVAPTGSATQIGINLSQIVLPSNALGSTQYQVLLYASNNSTLLYTWPATSSQAVSALTYSNASAASGSYNWHIKFIANASSAATFNPQIAANYSWYQLTNVSDTIYVENNGSTQLFPIPLTNEAPSSSATQLSLNIKSVNTTSNNNGHGSFNIQLVDSNSVVQQTWSGITQPQVLTYWALGSALGTWNWEITATTTNPGSGTGTYPASMSAVQQWYQLDQVPTIFYHPHAGQGITYKTSNLTVAPTGSGSQLSAVITALSLPANQFGSTYLDISLKNPNNTVVQTWSNISQPQTLSYSATGAISGPYTWTFTPNCEANNTGTALFIAQWGATLNYLAAIDNEVPTNQLIDRSIYLYLTVEGYPFHAVLDPLDDATKPLSYDTNNALLGTRYASMPTIHSIGGS